MNGYIFSLDDFWIRWYGMIVNGYVYIYMYIGICS